MGFAAGPTIERDARRVRRRLSELSLPNCCGSIFPNHTTMPLRPMSRQIRRGVPESRPTRPDFRNGPAAAEKPSPQDESVKPVVTFGPVIAVRLLARSGGSAFVGNVPMAFHECAGGRAATLRFDRRSLVLLRLALPFPSDRVPTKKTRGAPSDAARPGARRLSAEPPRAAAGLRGRFRRRGPVGQNLGCRRGSRRKTPPLPIRAGAQPGSRNPCVFGGAAEPTRSEFRRRSRMPTPFRLPGGPIGGNAVPRPEPAAG